jgi:hypothetical protein
VKLANEAVLELALSAITKVSGDLGSE